MVVVDRAEEIKLMEDGASEWGMSLLCCSLDEGMETKAAYGSGYKSDRILEREEIHGTLWQIEKEVLCFSHWDLAVRKKKGIVLDLARTSRNPFSAV